MSSTSPFTKLVWPCSAIPRSALPLPRGRWIRVRRPNIYRQSVSTIMDTFGSPFVGRLRAAGHTTSELQAMIQSGLRGMSQDPQVMVSIQESITNSVILAGEIAKPGRLVLSTNRESLGDAIALAGGYRGAAKDAVARVQRNGQDFEIRLSDLLDMPDEDVRVAPGDRITLISRPQSFSVLGAPNRADEIVFPRAKFTLAEAVAQAGGANPNAGDAGAIFVFRYVTLPNGTLQPTVYHLNMMRPGSYLFRRRSLCMIGTCSTWVTRGRTSSPNSYSC